ncbi:hypothetical protein GCM10011594_14940 [Nakamurella endophytica]|uniref:Hsp70 protein n=2 Tax=Nakamurella endophytica TaxID=1748367 RepID=A0A917WD80_9ACTN|nr:hypothetical protein GCM10011594_14940 [Nakamurella endophytica]
MRVLAIDFGTSNTVAALAVDGQAPRTVTFDASPLLPSCVWLAADGDVHTGRDALRQARRDPTRFEPNPKRRIDDGEVLLGDRVVPVVELIAAVLRTVAQEVRRQFGGLPPDEVRLTHPAPWGASRQNTLVAAARAAGLGSSHLVLIPEPVAAAAQFTRLPGRALPPGGTVAVYDLGGGTFDAAVVGRTGDVPTRPGELPGEFHVLAEGGLTDLGGLDLDQTVLDHVGRDAAAVDADRWQALLHPVDPLGRRAARAVVEEVRAGKEALSRHPQTDVALPEPWTDAHLTRQEFEALVRPQLSRSVDVLQATLRAAGVAPDRLTGVFLVGGSSRIPLVAQLIQARTGVTPVALDQPETAVALGALLVPVRRDGQRTVAIVDRPPADLAPAGRGVTGPLPAAGPPSTGWAPGSVATGPGPVGRGGQPGGQHGGPVPGRAGAGPGGAAGAGAVGGRAGRRGRWVAAAVAVVVLAAAGVLLVLRPWAAPSTASTVSTVSSASTASTASTVPTGASASGSPSGTAASSAGGTAAAPGSGGSPGGAGSSAATSGPAGQPFTAGESAFLGASAARLADCADVTSGYNSAVTPTLAVDRAVRCSVPEDFADPIIDRTLLYVLTAREADAAGWVDRAVSQRVVDKAYPDADRDQRYQDGGTAGRVVTAVELPALGRTSSGRGVSVLAWTADGKPYVGVVSAQGYTGAADLMGFWSARFEPRG